MFELPKEFDKNSRLNVAIVNRDEDNSSVKIGRKLYTGGWYNAKKKTIRFEETTYKHYKGYVSGAAIDMIQTLAVHSKAIRDFGVDEDGDVYWAVEFKIKDFARVIRL